MSNLLVSDAMVLPIIELIKNNHKLAKSYSKFLYDLGIKNPLYKDINKIKLKVFNINFKHKGVNRSLTIPLILLMQIPNLSINEFNLTFYSDLKANNGDSKLYNYIISKNKSNLLKNKKTTMKFNLKGKSSGTPASIQKLNTILDIRI